MITTGQAEVNDTATVQSSVVSAVEPPTSNTTRRHDTIIIIREAWSPGTERTDIGSPLIIQSYPAVKRRIISCCERKTAFLTQPHAVISPLSTTLLHIYGVLP